MKNGLVFVGVLAAATSLAGPPKKVDPTVNITGYWTTSNVGFYAHLRQGEQTISGCCSQDNCAQPTCFVRGVWSEGVLLLVRLEYNEAANELRCNRSTFVAQKKSPTLLLGKWVAGDVKGTGDGLNREGADPGPETAYPYENELKFCGDVSAYELVFASGSAELKNPDAPLLVKLAARLKADAALKLRVVGHTDDTGDAAKNKALSLKRAESVKKRLVALAGCDEKRVIADGLGQESPLEENTTPEGRAVNRRVEITVAR